MANAIVSRNISTYDFSMILATWVLTTADPTGVAVQFPEWADQTWQFGTSTDTLGGAVGAVQGCNTNVDADFQTLSNAAGSTPATFSAFGIKTTIENPVFLRPKLTTVGAGASITVSLLARRANPIRN